MRGLATLDSVTKLGLGQGQAVADVRMVLGDKEAPGIDAAELIDSSSRKPQARDMSF